MPSTRAAWVVTTVLALACRTDAGSPADPRRPTAPEPPMHEPTAPAPAPQPEASIAPPWTLVVADGSGNVYACSHTQGGSPRFEYRPVTPEHSSTGTYDGGPPRAGPLTDAQIERLWRHVDALARTTDAHVRDRAKGTVAIEAAGPTRASVIVTGAAGGALTAELAALPGDTPR